MGAKESLVGKQVATVIALLSSKAAVDLEGRIERWRHSPAIHKTVEMQLNKTNVVVWVDSCSPISMVDHHFVTKYSIPIHSTIPILHYSGLNSSQGLSFKGCVVFSLQIGGVVVEVIAAVLESTLPRGCEVLLGNYDMQINDLAVTLLHNKVIIRRSSQFNDVIGVSYPHQWLAAVGKDFEEYTKPPPLGVEQNETPPLGVEQNKTPPSGVEQNKTPPSGVEQNETPPSGVEQNETPPSGVERNETPPSGVEQNETPPSGVEQNETPPSGVEQNETPPSGVEQNVTPSEGLESRVSLREQPPTNVGKTAMLSHSRTLLSKGVYCLEVQIKSFATLPLGMSAVVEVVIPPQWSELLRVHQSYQWSVANVRGRVRLIVESLTEDMLVLPVSVAWGRVVLETTIDTYLRMKSKTHQLVGGVIGSTATKLPDTTATLSLNSELIRQLSRDAARKTIRKYRKLNQQSRLILQTKVDSIRKAGKSFKMEMGDPPPAMLPTTKQTWVPPGSHVWQPLAAADNASADLHDGPLIAEGVDDMAIGTEMLPELSDLEFFVALGCHDFKDEHQSLLIHRESQFLSVVTDIFRFRAAGLFRLNYNKPLAKIQGVQYQVLMKTGEENKPFDSGRRKYGDKETLEICRQVMQLIQSGILSPTRSAWSSGLVLVKKGDGGIRMCVDLRGINGKTLHVASQLPLIADVLQDSFAIQDKIFSQLDLSQAYHQLEVEQDSRKYLAFKLPRISASQCEELGFSPPFQVTWNRVPFGLSDAVTSFSNLVMEVFQPSGFSPYLDDLGTGASTVDQMQVKLGKIFSLAARHGLTFGSKLLLYASEIPFLGYVISNKGVSVSKKRVEELLSMKSPSNIHEVKVYLGAVGFCADYLGMNYAQIAAPLSDLLKDPLRKDFGWTEVHDNAIRELKQLLTNPPILKVFDNSLETSIITDGSVRGVGAVLQQKHSSTWYPVFYMSKKLSEVQSRWATSQFELYAIILALDRWRRFLIDRPFTLLSDHHALTYIKQPKLFEGRRLRRWQMLLSEYQFIIKYKPGVEIGLPDCLSRMAGVVVAGITPPPDEWSCADEGAGLAEGVIALEEFITAISPPHRIVKQVVVMVHQTVVTSSIMPVVGLTAATRSRYQRENISRKGFKAGDAVWAITEEWGRLEGSLLHRHWKGAGLKEEQWWLVDFSAAGHSDKWPCREDMLSSRSAEQVPLTSRVETDDLLSRTPILSPDIEDQQSSREQVEGATAPLPALEVQQPLRELIPRVTIPSQVQEVQQQLKESDPIWSRGDIVQVRIGHFQKFKLSVHSLQPLGRIEEVNELGIRVTLFLEGQPWHIIRPVMANKTLSLVASSKHLIDIKKSSKNLIYDVRDIVVVITKEKKKDIIKRLQKMEVFPVNYGTDHLVGVVVGRGHVNNSYYVHFGSVENGVEMLQQTDLALLKSSNIAQLAEVNLGALPSLAGLGQSSLDPDLLVSTAAANIKNKIRTEWLLEVARETSKDPELSRIATYLKDGIISPLWSQKLQLRLDKLKQLYEFEDGVLYVRDPKKTRKLWIPFSLRTSVCFLVHDSTQHFDWIRSYNLFATHFYMRGAPEIIRRYVGSCLSCQRNRAKKYWHKEYGKEMAERMYYFRPTRHWAIDLKPIAKGSIHQFAQLLVAIDLCSRFVIVIPLLDKTKETVTAAIYNNVIARYGAHNKEGSMEFLCDRGSEFINDYKDALFRQYRIQCIEIQERHSASNGMVERFMQTFNLHFSKVMQEKILNPHEWSIWVTQLATCFNALYHPILGNSPFYLMNGYDYELAPLLEVFGTNYTVTPSTVDRVSAELYTAQRARDYTLLLALLRARFLSSRRLVELERAFADRVPVFEVNDKVLVLLGDSNGGYLMKNRAHAGPFRIVGRSSTSNYQVAGADGKTVDVHGFKLLRYSESLADLLGNQGLAGSAVGAAASRLLAFEGDNSSPISILPLFQSDILGYSFGNRTSRFIASNNTAVSLYLTAAKEC